MGGVLGVLFHAIQNGAHMVHTSAVPCTETTCCHVQVYLNPELIWKPAALDIVVLLMCKFIPYYDSRSDSELRQTILLAALGFSPISHRQAEWLHTYTLWWCA